MCTFRLFMLNPGEILLVMNHWNRKDYNAVDTLSGIYKYNIRDDDWEVIMKYGEESESSWYHPALSANKNKIYMTGDQCDDNIVCIDLNKIQMSMINPGFSKDDFEAWWSLRNFWTRGAEIIQIDGK